MEFTLDGIVSLVMLLSGWVGIYAGFRAKITVLEQEVSNLKTLVTELRHDVKSLLKQT